MRTWRPTLLLTITAAIGLLAGPASADVPATAPPQTPAEPAVVTGAPALTPPLDPALFRPRANVASIGALPLLPVPPRWGGYYDPKPPLRTTGFVVLGLGIATMFGAGISAILTAAFTASLSNECPLQKCVEGTTGARSLGEARDAALATDWLIGIGTPVIASGTVMLIYSAVLERNYIGARRRDRFFAIHSPVLSAGPTGARFSFQF